jgi:hypothetical protein
MEKSVWYVLQLGIKNEFLISSFDWIKIISFW